MIISKEFRVGFLSIDSDLKIKNSAILNMFGEIAGVHSESIGAGFGASDLHWLLTAYKVNIIERPVHGEDITVITWSADYNSAIAAREFEIRNHEGKLLVTGMSNWVLVNFKTRRIEKLTPELMDSYQHEPDRSNYDSTRLKKLTEPKTCSSTNEIFIDWKWMDMNNHMNNTYYPEIAEHFLPDEIKMKIADCDFEVLYKKEIAENSNIKCLYEETDDTYVVTFKSEDLSVLHAIVSYTK